MLKDITIGQYYPADSLIHRLDPRTKLNFTFAYIVMLFVINNVWGYIAAFIVLMSVVILSKVPFGYLMRGVKGLIVIILLTVVLNLFMTPGTVVAQIWALTITQEGIRTSLFMALRLIFLVVGTSIMTLTTTPIDLTDGMERSMAYIPFIRHYAHELSMMMSIALRFIPTLMEETDKIMKAQKARGANLDTGNILQRAKALIPILVPLFISSFRRADELATAMEARCYRGGENRTKMKVLKYQRGDMITYGLGVVMIGILLATRLLNLPVLL